MSVYVTGYQKIPRAPFVGDNLSNDQKILLLWLFLNVQYTDSSYRGLIIPVGSVMISNVNLAKDLRFSVQHTKTLVTSLINRGYVSKTVERLGRKSISIYSVTHFSNLEQFDLNVDFSNPIATRSQPDQINTTNNPISNPKNQGTSNPIENFEDDDFTDDFGSAPERATQLQQPDLQHDIQPDTDFDDTPKINPVVREVRKYKVNTYVGNASRNQGKGLPAGEQPPLTSLVTEPATKFDLEALYAMYPKRHGDTGKRKGLTRLAARIKTQADYDELKAAVQGYATYCQVQRTVGTEKVAMFSTFVNSEDKIAYYATYQQEALTPTRPVLQKGWQPNGTYIE